MKEKELLEEISKKLNTLIAISLVPEVDKYSLTEKVELLTRFKLSNSEIAVILGTTKGTVEVIKSRLKKKAK